MVHPVIVRLVLEASSSVLPESTYESFLRTTSTGPGLADTVCCTSYMAIGTRYVLPLCRKLLGGILTSMIFVSFRE